ncbi:hypothetical protein [Nitrobacter sp.]|uniref:hypothetical protein n=1 Tax=Nitrobacter sp. TaxID=29420 RepID=UPI0029CAC589|nr:hypothetical protein [Nitrobacter sp.]
MDTITPGLGHNQPPEPTIIERGNALVETANRWLTERPELTDEDMAGKAQGFIDQLRAHWKTTDDARVAEKKPHIDAAKAVDDRYRDPLAKIDLALKLMREKMTAWLQAKQRRAEEEKRRQEEEARQAKEEAERAAKAAEEAAAKPGNDVIGAQIEAERAAKAAEDLAKAAAKPTETARVRGDYSTRAMGLRTYWHARVKPTPEGDAKAKAANEKEILAFFAKDPEGRAAMVAACVAIADKRAKIAKRVDAAPPGIEFYSDQRA